jgi:hypothetical protein
LRILFVLLLFQSLDCVAQGRPSPHASAKQPSSSRESNEMPFDVTRASLPIHYRGRDVQALWLLLNKQSALKAKSEYETSTEFQARLEVALHGTLPSGKKIDSQMAFVIPLEAGEYDADHQVLPVHPIPPKRYGQ